MTITEFIQARLDETETRANSLFFACMIPGKLPDFQAAGGPAAEMYWQHFTAHRMLRDVEFKRAILALHHPTRPHPEFGFTYPAAARFCGYDGPGDNWQAEQEPGHYPDALWPCWTTRLLAAIWADHPDYDPSWTPNPT